MVMLSRNTSQIWVSIMTVLCITAPAYPEAHDGDNNIFPGDDARMIRPSDSVKVLSFGKGFPGEVVPVEDSDRIPRVGKEPMSIEFTVDGEIFRFTHNRMAIEALKRQLESPLNEKTQVLSLLRWACM